MVSFTALPDTFHEAQMRIALREAALAAETDEVPMGCVIVRMRPDGSVAIVGKAHNQTEGLKDPTAHAEILAITQAAEAVGDWRLSDCALYVTKEPCPMCGGAIVLARLALVCWAVPDPKRGAHTVFNLFRHPGLNHHPPVLEGICEAEALTGLQAFFRARRSPARADDTRASSPRSDS